MGKVLSGNTTIFLYGNGGIITSASIDDPSRTFTVTKLIGTEIVNGVAQGRIYAQGPNGFEYTFVLTGKVVEMEN